MKGPGGVGGFQGGWGWVGGFQGGVGLGWKMENPHRPQEKKQKKNVAVAAAAAVVASVDRTVSLALCGAGFSLSLSLFSFFFSLFFWLLLLLSLRASVCVCVCWIVGSTTFDPRPRRTWAEKTPSVSFPRSPVVALVVPTPVAAGYGSPTAVKEQRKRQKKTNKNNEPAVSFVVRFSVPDCNHPPKKNMRSSHIYIYF